MSAHACSTDPCPSCNPRDYEAARTEAAVNAAAKENERFLALKPEIMDILSAADAELQDARNHSFDTEHQRRLHNVEFAVCRVLAKIEGKL